MSTCSVCLLPWPCGAGYADTTRLNVRARIDVYDIELMLEWGKKSMGLRKPKRMPGPRK